VTIKAGVSRASLPSVADPPTPLAAAELGAVAGVSRASLLSVADPPRRSPHWQPSWVRSRRCRERPCRRWPTPPRRLPQLPPHAAPLSLAGCGRVGVESVSAVAAGGGGRAPHAARRSRAGCSHGGGESVPAVGGRPPHTARRSRAGCGHSSVENVPAVGGRPPELAPSVYGEGASSLSLW